MANDYPTIIDVLATQYGNQYIDVAEVMTTKNQLLVDVPYVEATGLKEHHYSRRTGLPAGTHRSFNQGVAYSKATAEQRIAKLQEVAARNAIDVKQMEVQANPELWRAQRDRAFVAGLSKTLVDDIFYGNSEADPATETMDGFSRHVTSKTAVNAVDGGANAGTATCTSIWLVEWHPAMVYLAFPRGSVAGIDKIDLSANGPILVPDANNDTFRAWATEFSISNGLVVEDPGAIVRICNIQTTTVPDTLESLMCDAIEKLNPSTQGTRAFLVNSTIKAKLAKLQAAKTGNYSPFGGEPIVNVQGIPVRVCNSILNTESQLS